MNRFHLLACSAFAAGMLWSDIGFAASVPMRKPPVNASGQPVKDADGSRRNDQRHELLAAPAPAPDRATPRTCRRRQRLSASKPIGAELRSGPASAKADW